MEGELIKNTFLNFFDYIQNNKVLDKIIETNSSTNSHKEEFLHNIIRNGIIFDEKLGEFDYYLLLYKGYNK